MLHILFPWLEIFYLLYFASIVSVDSNPNEDRNNACVLHIVCPDNTTILNVSWVYEVCFNEFWLCVKCIQVRISRANSRIKIYQIKRVLLQVIHLLANKELKLMDLRYKSNLCILFMMLLNLAIKVIFVRQVHDRVLGIHF